MAKNKIKTEIIDRESSPSIGDKVWFYYKGKQTFGNLVDIRGGYLDVQPEGCWWLVELIEPEINLKSRTKLSKKTLNNWKRMVQTNYKTRLKYNII